MDSDGIDPPQLLFLEELKKIQKLKTERLNKSTPNGEENGTKEVKSLRKLKTSSHEDFEDIKSTKRTERDARRKENRFEEDEIHSIKPETLKKALKVSKGFEPKGNNNSSGYDDSSFGDDDSSSRDDTIYSRKQRKSATSRRISREMHKGSGKSSDSSSGDSKNHTKTAMPEEASTTRHFVPKAASSKIEQQQEAPSVWKSTKYSLENSLQNSGRKKKLSTQSQIDDLETINRVNTYKRSASAVEMRPGPSTSRFIYDRNTMGPQSKSGMSGHTQEPKTLPWTSQARNPSRSCHEETARNSNESISSFEKEQLKRLPESQQLLSSNKEPPELPKKPPRPKKATNYSNDRRPDVESPEERERVAQSTELLPDDEPPELPDIPPKPNKATNYSNDRRSSVENERVAQSTESDDEPPELPKIPPKPKKTTTYSNDRRNSYEKDRVAQSTELDDEPPELPKIPPKPKKTTNYSNDRRSSCEKERVAQSTESDDEPPELPEIPPKPKKTTNYSNDLRSSLEKARVAQSTESDDEPPELPKILPKAKKSTNYSNDRRPDVEPSEPPMLPQRNVSSPSVGDSIESEVQLKPQVNRQPTIRDIVGRHSAFRIQWKEILFVKESGLLDNYNKKLIKFQETKFEVVSTEASFLRDLNDLNDNYMFHLKQHITSGILSDYDYKILFKYVAPVKKCSENLLGDLEKLWQSDITLNGIFDVLNDHFSNHYQPYVDYCKNLPHIQKHLEKLLEDENFQVLLATLSNRQEMARTIDSYLLTPMQRITKINLLMSNLKAALRPNSEEYESCKSAQEAASKIGDECNRKKQTIEELLELYSKITFQKDLNTSLLESKNRKILFQVSVMTTNIVVKAKLHLILFNDLFLVTKPIEKRFLATQCCTKDELQIKRKVRETMEIKLKMNNKQSLNVKFQNLEDYDKWLTFFESS